MKRDEKGRIVEFDENEMEGFPYGGHSVCNGCGKDMPGCWNVVCSRCRKTFCYDCSKIKSDKWYCKGCR